jgi:hypothetical protein
LFRILEGRVGWYEQVNDVIVRSVSNLFFVFGGGFDLLINLYEDTVRSCVYDVYVVSWIYLRCSHYTASSTILVTVQI